MHNTLPLIALTAMAVMQACPAAAAPAGINFRALEFQQPRDPLLPSNQSTDIEEHSPQANLSAAATALNAALPAGTPRATAEALLRKAGANCLPRNGASETCSYFAVETRDEYVDAIHWNVQLALADDRVSGVSIDRAWVRD